MESYPQKRFDGRVRYNIINPIAPLMDEVSMQNGQHESPTQNAVAFSKKKVWFVVIAVAAVILVLACIFAWFGYFSPEARGERASQKQAEQAQRALDELEEAMRNDTYGGATPEETLQLFIAALEAGDIDLASKYFTLEDNMNDPDYLTRRKWENIFLEIKNGENLERLASDLKQYARLGDISNENTSGFVLYNDDGTVGLQINMKRSSSGVWKIESL